MQWKSDPIRKKGKACKEKRKLGLLPALQIKDGKDDAIKKSSVAWHDTCPCIPELVGTT